MWRILTPYLLTDDYVKKKKEKKNLRHNNSIIEVHKPVKLQLQQSQLLGLQSRQLEALHLLLFHC